VELLAQLEDWSAIGLSSIDKSSPDTSASKLYKVITTSMLTTLAIIGRHVVTVTHVHEREKG